MKTLKQIIIHKLNFMKFNFQTKRLQVILIIFPHVVKHLVLSCIILNLLKFRVVKIIYGHLECIFLKKIEYLLLIYFSFLFSFNFLLRKLFYVIYHSVAPSSNMQSHSINVYIVFLVFLINWCVHIAHCIIILHDFTANSHKII